MQIAINISEESYKNIKEQVDKRDYPDMQIGRAIVDGKPLPKGHWIRVAGGSLIDDYRCDCCNHQPPIRKVGSTWGWDFSDYCPNCGARMFEPQESDIEIRKPCINCEDGCEEWAGCPCVYYKAESEADNG